MTAKELEAAILAVRADGLANGFWISAECVDGVSEDEVQQIVGRASDGSGFRQDNGLVIATWVDLNYQEVGEILEKLRESGRFYFARVMHGERPIYAASYQLNHAK